MLVTCLLPLTSLPLIAPARAADIYRGNMIDIRWDNTVRYSAAFRLSAPDAALLSSPNGDDGDRNFAPGLISNRLDLISRFDLSHGEFGLHVSAAAWYDTVYHARTANRSPATYNPIGVPSTKFAPAVRDLYGQYAELRNAFVYGTFSISDAPVSFRLGRQTLIWGESLFFDQDSIAAAQAPIDYTTSFTDRSDYTSYIFLPVDQLSLTAQPATDLSLSFYYQVEWRPSRQPGDGSYFSITDYVGSGANRILLPGHRYFTRSPDMTPPSGGQFGIAAHLTLDDLTIGAYALRFASKDPIVALSINQSGTPGNAGTYRLVYPGGIKLYGVSFSTTLDNDIIAGELSFRQNAPFARYLPGAPAAVLPSVSDPDADGYARGNRLDARLSASGALSPSRLWDSADFSLEIAGDDVVDITKYPEYWNPAQDRFVLHARAEIKPHYFEVLPNLDITVPLDIGHNLVGHYLSYSQYGGTNDVAIGVSAIYRSVWKSNITLTDFFGSTGLSDRAFVMMSVERTL